MEKTSRENKSYNRYNNHSNFEANLTKRVSKKKAASQHHECLTYKPYHNPTFFHRLMICKIANLVPRALVPKRPGKSAPETRLQNCGQDSDYQLILNELTDFQQGHIDHKITYHDVSFIISERGILR